MRGRDSCSFRKPAAGKAARSNTNRHQRASADQLGSRGESIPAIKNSERAAVSGLCILEPVVRNAGVPNLPPNIPAVEVPKVGTLWTFRGYVKGILELSLKTAIK